MAKAMKIRERIEKYASQYQLTGELVAARYCPDSAEEVMAFLCGRESLAAIPEAQKYLIDLDAQFSQSLAHASEKWCEELRRMSGRCGFAISPWWVAVSNATSMLRGETLRLSDLLARADIWVTIEGSSGEAGAIPSGQIVDLVRGVKSGIRGCAGSVLERPAKKMGGRYKKDFARYSELGVTAVVPGSIQFGIRLPRQPESDEPEPVSSQAAELFLEAVDALSESASAEPDLIRDLIPQTWSRKKVTESVNALRRAIPASSEVLKLQMPAAHEGHGTTARLEKRCARRRRREKPQWHEVEVVGEIRAIDLDKRTIRIRDKSANRFVVCQYQADSLFLLSESPGSYLGKIITVHGSSAEPPDALLFVKITTTEPVLS